MVDIEHRSRLAITCLRKYSKGIYNRPRVSLEIKVRMLKADVLETMLYGCVAWSPNADHYDKLRTQHHRFLLRCIGFLRMKDEVGERGDVDPKTTPALRRVSCTHGGFVCV